MTPVNNDDYQTFAGDVLDEQDMEAVAANAEQGEDMNQVIRHNQYIGWILGVSKIVGTPLVHKGGNQVTIAHEALHQVTLIIPYPPEEWIP